MARRALAFDGPPGTAKKGEADRIQLEAERLRQAALAKLKQALSEPPYIYT